MAHEINVNPNPFVGMIDIEITCFDSKDCIILLADMQSSRIVRIVGAGLNKGTNKISLDDLDFLQNGHYHLDIKNTEGESLFSQKLEKA